MPNHKASKKVAVNDKSPVIKCGSCDAEIKLVPNVKLMSEAIETHVEKHRLKQKDPMKADAEADQIRDDLIARIFHALVNSNFFFNYYPQDKQNNILVLTALVNQNYR